MVGRGHANEKYSKQFRFVNRSGIGRESCTHGGQAPYPSARLSAQAYGAMNQLSRRPGYILVIEDDLDLRLVQTELLTEEGYDVQAAADGVAALEILAERGPPTLTILDLRMPGMNGWDFATRLRVEDAWKHVPLVVVSAHYRIAEEATALGARHWLHKPVSIRELLDVVERIHAERTGGVDP